jgi:hypothetical protein
MLIQIHVLILPRERADNTKLIQAETLFGLTAIQNRAAPDFTIFTP